MRYIWGLIEISDLNAFKHSVEIWFETLVETFEITETFEKQVIKKKEHLYLLSICLLSRRNNWDNNEISFIIFIFCELWLSDMAKNKISLTHLTDLRYLFLSFFKHNCLKTSCMFRNHIYIYDFFLNIKAI